VKRLLPLALALAACSLVPLPPVALPDLTLPVQPATSGTICYRLIQDQPRPTIGSVTVSGRAQYQPGTPAATATVSFYGRLDDDFPATVSYGDYRCVEPSAADTLLGGPLTLERGGPAKSYSFGGSTLDEGVRRGRYWIGARLDVPSSIFAIVQDYGQIDFTDNKVSARLR
jgi:hypothetical protein